MFDVNKVTLMGRVGIKPKMTVSPKNGIAVVRFRMATNRSYLNKQGVRITETEWHNVVVFGRRAVNVFNNVEVGQRVYVEGEIVSSKYTDAQGVERYSTTIKADWVNHNYKKEKTAQVTMEDVDENVPEDQQNAALADTEGGNATPPKEQPLPF